MSLSHARHFGEVCWRPKHTHTHTQPATHTHQPAPFSPAIQTHSHAFTHLLGQPHEELKIDDCTMQGVGGRRGTGEKDEQSSQKKHRAHRGWEEEEMEERKKYDIAKKKTINKKKMELWDWGRRKSWFTVTWLQSWAQLSPISCLTYTSSQLVNLWRTGVQ